MVNRVQADIEEGKLEVPRPPRIETAAVRSGTIGEPFVVLFCVVVPLVGATVGERLRRDAVHGVAD